jgi:predicted choloylglycine hydrolase
LFEILNNETQTNSIKIPTETGTECAIISLQVTDFVKKGPYVKGLKITQRLANLGGLKRSGEYLRQCTLRYAQVESSYQLQSVYPQIWNELFLLQRHVQQQFIHIAFN